MADTLFEKYGGFETLSKVVANFYDKILDSNKVKHYFEGINMDRLMQHQTNFIAKALGGPDKYEGGDLKKMHARFNITEDHFTEVAELLEEALDEAGVESDDTAAIISVVASLKDQIVSEAS
jgi:hemoglobin